MKALFLATFLLPAACLAVTDPATGIVFPDPAGPWVFTETRTYETPDLGRSYSYQPLFGGTGVITCYIYNKGYRGIPNGVESRLLGEEFSETVASVRDAWTQLGATVEELEPATPYFLEQGGRALALYGVHRITHDAVENISISAVTGYRGNFVKLRYTYPGHDVARAKHQLALFLKTLRETNRETADPDMIPVQVD